MRQLVLAKSFAEDGYEVAIFGFDKHTGGFGSVTRVIAMEDVSRGADVVILGLPYSVDGVCLTAPLSKAEIPLRDFVSSLQAGQLVAGGRLDDVILDLTKEKSLRLHDYYEREELSVKNSIPTAEGAISIAMQEIPITIHGSTCIVLGYGRLGKILSARLRGLGAKVYCAARKHEDFAWIDAAGLISVHIDDISAVLPECNVIFNTVPHTLLDRRNLLYVDPDAVIIDLASKPGGVNFEAAKDLSLKVIWALSLPGKVAPVTAGKIIKESIINIMKSEGIKI